MEERNRRRDHRNEELARRIGYPEPRSIEDHQRHARNRTRRYGLVTGREHRERLDADHLRVGAARHGAAPRLRAGPRHQHRHLVDRVPRELQAGVQRIGARIGSGKQR